MSKWMNCFRYTVYGYIVLYCVTGVADVITISYILMRRFGLRYFVGSLRISLYVSYLAPLLVFATAAWGWSSVTRRSHKAIKIFSLLTLMTVCVEIALCVWTFLEKEDLGRITTDVLTEKFTHSETRSNNSAWWDTLQTDLKCCGVHGPEDYRTAHQAVPFSCCETRNVICNQIWSSGCLLPFIDILSDDFIVVSLCLLIVSLCQIPGVFLSWALANRVERSQLNPI